MSRARRPSKAQRKLFRFRCERDGYSFSPPRRQSAYRLRLEELEDRTVFDAGQLDPTFGIGGEATTPWLNAIGTSVGGVAIQPTDQKIVVAGSVQLSTSASRSVLALARHLPNGQWDQDAATGFGPLDPSTGIRPGRFTIDLTPGMTGFQSVGGVIVQPDGKIIVAGSAPILNGTSKTGVLVRLNPDGTYDRSFGTPANSPSPGVVDLTFPGQITNINAVALENSQIVVGGSLFNLTSGLTRPFAARFNAEGSLDTSFASVGYVVTSYDPVSSFQGLSDMALDVSGGLVMAGVDVVTGVAVLGMIRLNADGTLDTSFGSGQRVTPLAGMQVSGVAIQPDQNIVVVGPVSTTTANGTANADFGVVRYLSSGALDSGFGSGGAVRVDFGGQDDSPGRVVVQPDGEILIAGKTTVKASGTSEGYSDFALVRLNPNGSPDSGFGTNGEVATSFTANTGRDGAGSLLIQPDGRIVLAGVSKQSFALARYLIGATPPPPPHANRDFYVLPAGAGPGQSFPSDQAGAASVLNNDDSPAGIRLHARLVQGPAHSTGFSLAPNGSFTYVADASFRGTDTFTYVATDGFSDSNVATVVIVTTGSAFDSDGDGVPDVVEMAAPNGGVGNFDGTPDCFNPKVASLPAADGQYWTLITSFGTFADVGNMSAATFGGPPLPTGIGLQAGLFGFRIRGLQPGDADVVSLTPQGFTQANAYYNYNPAAGGWYNFAPVDPNTGIGADMSFATIVKLHFVDGQRGDFDGTPDGVITAFGGPAAGFLAPDIHVPLPHGTTGPQTIAANASQVNHQSVSLELVTGPGNDPAYGTVQINQQTGSFVYTPTTIGGLVFPDSFAYRVTNSVSHSAVGRVFLEPANQPIANDFQEVVSAFPVHFDPINVIPHTSSPDGTPTLLVGVGHPENPNATAAVAPGADHIEYTPQHGVRTIDHVVYTIADAHGDTASATVTVVVDDPPTPNSMVVGDLVGYDVDLGHTLQGDLSHWFDFHQDPSLSVARVTSDVHQGILNGTFHGQLSLQPDGSFTYTPIGGFLGTDTFTFVFDDGLAQSPEVTVQIKVVPPRALANTDDFYVRDGDTLRVPNPGCLGNDRDGYGQVLNDPTYTLNNFSLEVRASSQPGVNPARAGVPLTPGIPFDTAYGTLTFRPGGGFDYTPRGPLHDDSFVYRFRYDLEFGPTSIEVLSKPDIFSNNGSADWTSVYIHVLNGGDTGSGGVVVVKPLQNQGILNTVTISVPDGQVLANVQTINPADLRGDAPPAGLVFPMGLFSFEVLGVAPGATTQVTLDENPPTGLGFSYWKFGPSAQDPTPHWYPFSFNTATQIGPIFDPSGNPIVLRLGDGQDGDEDQVANGVIIDPGGPAYFDLKPAVAGPMVGVRGRSLTFTASARDLGPSEWAAGFTYTIDWGDGSPVQVVPRSPTNGTGVPLDHAFRKSGALTVKISATDIDGYTSPPATTTITITDPPVAANGRFSIAATEGADSASQTVATFTDAGGAEPVGYYTATIAWGDGTSSAGVIVFDQTTQRFTVSGHHAYAGEGSFPITVTIQDGSSPKVTVASAAAVADAPLTATPVAVSATAGGPFSGVVGAFTDANPNGTLGEYSATILWGDGTSTPGVVAADGHGGYVVAGSITYAAAGKYTLSVQIRDAGGSSVTDISTANVANLGQSVQSGLADGIGFWHNANGQALINNFNGGGSSTALANWLAASFPNLYGVGTGANNLNGLTNAQVVGYFETLFVQHGPKLGAQVLAMALDIYATTRSLGGTAGSAYGFRVTDYGLGAYSFNIGSAGAAFDVANNTVLNVYQILRGVDRRAVNGLYYNGDLMLDQLALGVFDGIASAGSIP
jgi:uncharacterized delta-60 repeat protein